VPPLPALSYGPMVRFRWAGMAQRAERTRRELALRSAEALRRCEEIEERRRDTSERVVALEAELADLERRSEEAREQAVRAEQTALNEAQTQVAVAEEACRNQRLILEREVSLLEQLQEQATVLRRQVSELESEQAAVDTTVSPREPLQPAGVENGAYLQSGVGVEG
jgi:chromosome segregation ATPase